MQDQDWGDLQDYGGISIGPENRLVSFLFRMETKEGFGLIDQDFYSENLRLSGISRVNYADEDWDVGSVGGSIYSETIILHGFDIPEGFNGPAHHVNVRVVEYNLQKQEINDLNKHILLANNNFTMIYQTQRLKKESKNGEER